MATNTPNLQLVKPAPEDFYDIAVHNENMVKIDTAIKELQDRPSGGVQTTGGTMTGKLNIETNGEAVAVKGTNTSYHAFYRGGVRQGVVGFGESTNNNFFIINEAEDGNIIFRFNNGDEIDLNTLRAVANGSINTSLYVSSDSETVASVGIGGHNSTNIHFTGDDLATKFEIDLDQMTEVLTIKNH